jgi:hypothetical protein
VACYRENFTFTLERTLSQGIWEAGQNLEVYLPDTNASDRQIKPNSLPRESDEDTAVLPVRYSLGSGNTLFHFRVFFKCGDRII